jgi:hypothetical protein
VRIGPRVRGGGVGVGDERLRQVRPSGLVQSFKSESVVQVVWRKVVVLENRPSLDAALCKEVDQENRDVIGLSTREVLGAPEVLVLVCAMRDGWAALRDQRRRRDCGGGNGIYILFR